MERKKSTTFKISHEDERPDSLFRARNKKDLRIEKVQQRLTLLAILIPCLVAAMLYFFYQHFQQAMGKTQGAGVQKIQRISADIETRYEEISEKFKGLEKNIEVLENKYTRKVQPLDEILLAFEKINSSMKDSLKKMEKSVDELYTSKADKQELQELRKAIETLDAGLLPVKESLDVITADLKIVDERISKEVAALSESIRQTATEFESIRSEIAKISETAQSGLTRNDLDQALQKQQKTFQDQLNPLIKDMKIEEKRVKVIQEKVEELERAMDKSAKANPAAGDASQRASPDSDKVELPTIKVIPKPGSYVEQDLE